MRATLVCRAVLACLLVVCAALSPPPIAGQSLDISDPPCGLAGDSAYVTTGGPYTWNPFHYYKVPVALSRRANRDFEFLWSDTYKSSFHMPLDSLSGTPAMTDIDRLGLVACEERGRNPFGLLATDLQLAYDFLAQRQTLDSLGVPIERRSTYNPDQNAPIGFRVAQPSYPDAERTHIDAYIFGRQFSGYGQWASYAGDGWESGDRIYNYGLSPSGYWWAATEDSATVNDPVFYHENSLQIPGPFPSQVGNTGPGRWTRPGGTANTQLIHESLHAINYDAGQGNWLHMFASGAEVITGVSTDPPTSDVDYRFGLTPGPGGGLLSASYMHWMGFMAYLTFNFRGADTTAGGYPDDLVPRWAKEDAAQRSLLGLARRLRDVECVECQTYPGFAGIDSVDRVTRLIHDWRVASYVNNDALPGGHYGFPSGYGFSPVVQLGAWQNVNGVAADDWAVTPPETTLTPADRGHTGWINQRPPVVPAALRKLRLGMFGAEYFVFRAASALASTQQTLQLRVRMPELVKSTAVTSPVAWQCVTTEASGRITASVVRYSQSADSLFRHPNWATSVTTVSAVLDSARGDLILEVPSFGPETKAALLVITLGDGPSGFYSRMGATYEASTDSCTIEIGVGLVPQGAITSPLSVGASGEGESGPSWSPDGSQLAFQRVDGSGIARILLGASAGTGTPTLLRPATTGQYEPSWSPRGDAVMYAQESGSDRHLWLVNPTTGAAQQLTSLTGLARAPAVSPNGGRVAYARDWLDGSTRRWEVRAANIAGGSDELLTTFEGDSAVLGLCWTADGRHLLFTRFDETDEVRHQYQLRVTTHELTIHDDQAPDALRREVSPGAGPLLVEELLNLTFPLTCEWPWAALYCGCQSGGLGYLPAHWIALRDTLAGTSRPIAYRTGVEFSAPRWSPDGTRVAYVTTQNGNPDVYVAPATFDRAPIFSSSVQSSYSLPTCMPFELGLSATDPDGDAITYEVFDLPAGARFQTGNQIYWGVPVVGQYWLIARALDPQGAVATRLIRLDVYSPDACGGEGGEDPPPILPGGHSAREVGTSRLIGGDGPLRIANTFLDGAPNREWVPQVARLMAPSADSAGYVSTRFAALRPGLIMLDRVRLLVADHAPGAVAVATASGIAIGARREPALIRTGGGEVVGSTPGTAPDGARLFAAGSTLDVEWAAGDTVAGLVLDCARAGAPALDAPWGVEVQVPDASGWRSVGRIQPRGGYDALALSTGSSAAARVVFLTDTYVRGVEGYGPPASTAGAVTAVELSGTDVESGVEHLAAADTVAVELAQGQRVTLLFDGPPPQAGLERTYFLDLIGEVERDGVSGARSGQAAEELPVRFALRGNQPNPFGGGTTIRFDVPRASVLRLDVFDAQGRRIRTLADRAFEPGTHALVWDGTDAAGQQVRPGVYLYRMVAPGFRDQRRMVLLGR